MKIQNLHQPFVFEEDGEIKIISSQILSDTFDFKFGNYDVNENYWKLKILDLENTIINIVTPSSITINNVFYHIVAECNGFLYDNKLSYMIGVHTKNDNEPLYLYLVVGDFNVLTKTVTNLSSVGRVRTGYVKGSDVYTVDFINNILTINQTPVFDYSSYINSTARIIGVHNDNRIIITGYKNEEFVSYVYSPTEKTFLKLKNTDGNNIYKSSFYGDNINGVLAYAKRENFNKNITYELTVSIGYDL